MPCVDIDTKSTRPYTIHFANGPMALRGQLSERAFDEVARALIFPLFRIDMDRLIRLVHVRSHVSFLTVECSESEKCVLPRLQLRPAAPMKGLSQALTPTTGLIALNPEWDLR